MKYSRLCKLLKHFKHMKQGTHASDVLDHLLDIVYALELDEWANTIRLVKVAYMSQ